MFTVHRAEQLPLRTKKLTMTTTTKSTLLHLECGMCHKIYEANKLVNLCNVCGRPLLARYDLEKAKITLTTESLGTRIPSLWRYEEVLPIQVKENMLTLGEGWTLLHHAKRLGSIIGCPGTYIKDESTNATGSFKARGLSVAVSRAKELGVTQLSIPSAGNAGNSLLNCSLLNYSLILLCRWSYECLCRSSWDSSTCIYAKGCAKMFSDRM